MLPTESHVIMLTMTSKQTGKNIRYIHTLVVECCAQISKNVAQIGRQNTRGGVITEMFLILAIILATKGTFPQSFRLVK